MQGAPGTGRTAVGLHRAAYLLYTHGGQLARTGVLVVGPSRAFLRYIEQVLPTLGEVDDDQTTVAWLTARVPVRGTDAPEVAVLKGDARMAEVLHRALWGSIAKPGEDVQVPMTGRRRRVPVERLKRYVDDLRRRGRAGNDQQVLHHAAGRERLAMLLAEDARRQAEAAGASPTDAETRRAARSREVRAFCDAVWPAWNAAELVHTLLTDPAVLARAARGVLDDAEQALLLRSPGPLRGAPWTEADAVLVDEVVGLPGARRGARVRQPAAAGDRPGAAGRHGGAPRGRLAAHPARRPAARRGARARRHAGIDRRGLRRHRRGRGGRRAGRRGAPAPVLGDDGDAGLLAVVPATLAKGLEFDAVVVVDPAAIAAAEPRGLHRLYIVLTRAVSTPVVLHTGYLPEPLVA